MNVVTLTRPTTRAAGTEVEVLAVVEAAKGGDHAALQRLHDLFADRIQRTIGAIVGDERDAEDLTQEVFIKVMGTLHRFQPQGRPFGAWLQAVARNAALDHVRATRPTAPVSEEIADAHPAHEHVLDRRTDLLAALAALSDEQRAVVMLRHFVGLSAAEVAQRLGRSSASVYSLDHRAVVSLRRDLSRAAAAPAVTHRAA